MSTSSKRELESQSPAVSKSSKKRKLDDVAKEERTQQYSPAQDASSEELRPATSDSRETYIHSPKNLLQLETPPPVSAYTRKTIYLDLYIPPIDTSDPMTGIYRQLDDVLLSYVKEAGGLLMGWTDVHFTSASARILDEHPFSLTTVRVTVLVWRPRRGESVTGSVKLMGPSHIGLLILGTFNASIPRPLIPPSWTFEENFDDEGTGYWRTHTGRPIQVDELVTFITSRTRKGANILSVEGSLLDLAAAPEEDVKEEQKGQLESTQHTKRKKGDVPSTAVESESKTPVKREKKGQEDRKGAKERKERKENRETEETKDDRTTEQKEAEKKQKKKKKKKGMDGDEKDKVQSEEIRAGAKRMERTAPDLSDSRTHDAYGTGTGNGIGTDTVDRHVDASRDKTRDTTIDSDARAGADADADAHAHANEIVNGENSASQHKQVEGDKQKKEEKKERKERRKKEKGKEKDKREK